jgi:3-hydroxyacyl-CoA dehydrogenase/enoyl-CoA hydratase/3-hydroxybutyryl-CoA epimerase
MAFYQTDNLHVARNDDGVATLVLDVAERSMNVFTRQVLSDLDAALDRISAEPGLRRLEIQSGKPTGFIAGADLHEFTRVATPRDAQELSLAGQRLFDKLADLPVPSVAVISGPCLGGGLEFALACDYRIVVDHAKTQLGLPEIEIGLLPGWGGTQRLPRVVGLERALQIILGGKRLKAAEALQWGLADAVQQPAGNNLAIALANPVKRPKQGLPLRTWRQRLLESTRMGRWLILRGAERLVRRRTPDDFPPPLEALQALRIGLQEGMAAGQAYERAAIGRLAATPASRNLIQLFFQREQARKVPPKFQARQEPPIRQVGIVGAGTMGAGIAQLAALKGCEVVIREINETALAAGVLRIFALINKAVERGILPAEESQRRLNSIHGTTAWKGFSDLDLVIEAVIEELQAKKAVFREMEKEAAPSAILATNTSSLSVRQLQEGLKHPGRVAGLHFFNPVHKMPLVEVVQAPATTEEAVAALVRWAIQLGKTPIVVKDSPGFVVNRILMPYLNEAVLLAGEGMPIPRIDQAMRRFGMPMGPLELIDQVGLDVAAHIARSMETLFGDRFPRQDAFQQMQDRGWLGQKSGLGFYRYKGKKKKVNEAAVAILREATSEAAKASRDALSPHEQKDQARERMVYLMVNEAAACLGEGIVENAFAIDLAMVLGTGWAPHRGGPLQYGEDRGYGRIVIRMQELAQQFGARFEPCAELRRLAAATVGQPQMQS